MQGHGPPIWLDALVTTGLQSVWLPPFTSSQWQVPVEHVLLTALLLYISHSLSSSQLKSSSSASSIRCRMLNLNMIYRCSYLPLVLTVLHSARKTTRVSVFCRIFKTYLAITRSIRRGVWLKKCLTLVVYPHCGWMVVTVMIDKESLQRSQWQIFLSAFSTGIKFLPSGNPEVWSILAIDRYDRSCEGCVCEVKGN